MPRPPANPNSRYSRNKRNKEFRERYSNMTPEQRSNIDSWSGGMILFIVVIVFGLAFLFGGENGLSCAAKWASR